MSTKISVLVVDDEEYVRESLAEVLRAEGMRVTTTSGASEAREVLSKKRFDVIVTDLAMPSGDGFELLEESRAAGIATPIVVISGVGTVSDAVTAMKAGAFDFLQKPVDPDEIVLVVRRAAERRELEVEVSTLRRTVARLEPTHRIIERSPAMARVVQRLTQVAATDSVVLVRGESGVGKELVAAEIHRRGARSRGPYVIVDAATITEDSFEFEIAGARGGNAGILAQAESGTIVLDNVATLGLGVQSRFLRLIESGTYVPRGTTRAREADVRWIATASEDLEAAVAAGRFRADLLFRLDVFRIDVPPLRDRREDVPELARILLSDARARIHGGNLAEAALSADAVEALTSYGWPGNVRELRNALERAAILSEGAPIGATLLRDVLEITLAPRPAMAGAELNLRRNLELLERSLVLKALAKTRGKKREACDLLGIDARNLGYYFKKHRIREDEVRLSSEG